MNPTALGYATAAVALLLIGQASTSPLITNTIYSSTQASESTTEDLLTTTELLGTFETEIKVHQDAIRWFRVYRYMPQEDGIACESCPPEDCPTDCLQLLKDLAMAPLIEFQKFYKFTPTGILTREEINKMKEPRCGNTDERPGRDLGKGARTKRWTKTESNLWPAEMMPLQISVNGGVRGFDVRKVEELALECARLWAGPSSLYFQLAARGVKGNIDIISGYIDGQGNVTGHGYEPQIYGDKTTYLIIEKSEMWIRDDITRSRTNGYGASLKWTICHEMGHNLGLSHSSDSRALMYPSAIAQNEETLPRDDYVGITTLYPGRNGRTVSRRAPAPRHTPAPRRPHSQPSPRAPYRPTTRPRTRARPTTHRSPTTRRVQTRPPPTRAPNPPTRYRNTTPYGNYRPRGQNYAPPGHQTNYRPSPSPTTSSTNQWNFDAAENRWVYG